MITSAVTSRLIIFVILALAPVGRGGDPLNNRHGVAHGEDYQKASDVYLARTPYTLEWNASATWTPDKKNPSWKARDNQTCVHVYNEKGEIIARSPWVGLSGKIYVSQPGRHRVQVYSLGKWTANIIENAEMLKQAHREGYLTERSILDSGARARSIVGKRETVAAAMREDLRALELEKRKIPSIDPDRISKINKIEEQEHLVKLAASRASGVDDYEKRKAALVK